MPVNKIVVANPNPNIINAPQEEGAVARVADVNKVVSDINASIGYDTLSFNIVAIGGTSLPGFVIPGANGNITSDPTADKPNCRAQTCPFQYSNGTWGCTSCSLVFGRTGTGVYTVTFPTAPALGYDVYFTPPVVLAGTRIKVEKTSSSVFTITTTDVSGGASDGLLTGMGMSIRVYTN